MLIFCTVVDEGGFTAAARAMRHTVSHVSKEVARLEQRLDTRLLNRTTRKISLTESGRLFYERSRRVVDDAEAAVAQIVSSKDHPFGHLKVSTPVMFAEACLNFWLPEFVAQFPDVTHDIEVSDRFVDIIGEGFDVVVRAGDLKDTDLVARKLMETRQLTVASPNYMKVHGTPHLPEDLKHHTLIDFSYRGISNNWRYRNPDGKPLSVKVEPKIRCNSASMEIALAASGFGITRIPQLAAEEDIRSGRLLPVLETYENEQLVLHAVYPSRQHLSPKVRVFVEFLARRCQQRQAAADQEFVG